LHVSTPHERSVPSLRQPYVGLARPLALLLESVKDEDAFTDMGDINHPECAGRLPKPDLPHACANRRHRLPVVRFLSSLHATELKTRLAPRIFRKILQVFQR
jgi:hypothetical protein